MLFLFYQKFTSCNNFLTFYVRFPPLQRSKQGKSTQVSCSKAFTRHFAKILILSSHFNQKKIWDSFGLVRWTWEWRRPRRRSAIFWELAQVPSASRPINHSATVTPSSQRPSTTAPALRSSRSPTAKPTRSTIVWRTISKPGTPWTIFLW